MPSSPAARSRPASCTGGPSSSAVGGARVPAALLRVARRSSRSPRGAPRPSRDGGPASRRAERCPTHHGRETIPAIVGCGEAGGTGWWGPTSDGPARCRWRIPRRASNRPATWLRRGHGGARWRAQRSEAFTGAAAAYRRFSGAARSRLRRSCSARGSGVRRPAGAGAAPIVRACPGGSGCRPGPVPVACAGWRKVSVGVQSDWCMTSMAAEDRGRPGPRRRCAADVRPKARDGRSAAAVGNGTTGHPSSGAVHAAPGCRAPAVVRAPEDGLTTGHPTRQATSLSAQPRGAR